ncbi:hypothetical protein PMALA_049670 [Plasmodium malariae]|uniref:Plasmodium RESA N-terminal domain-containing protein n=1 Tax=Plasmodium malariae TaxID=5858 RepID=A0A1A8WSH9_PLAMA|nr:hypothetical protein PMALA_049670 [Plasmodium malariae]
MYGAEFGDCYDSKVQFNEKYLRNLTEISENLKNDKNKQEINDGNMVLTEEDNTIIYEIPNDETPFHEEDIEQHEYNDDIYIVDIKNTPQDRYINYILEDSNKQAARSDIYDYEYDNNYDMSKKTEAVKSKILTLDDYKKAAQENLKKNMVQFIQKKRGTNQNGEQEKASGVNYLDYIIEDNIDLSKYKKKDPLKYIIKDGPEDKFEKRSEEKTENKTEEKFFENDMGNEKNIYYDIKDIGDNGNVYFSCLRCQKKKKKKICKMQKRVNRYEVLAKYFGKSLRNDIEGNVEDTNEMNKLLFGDIDYNSNVGGYTTSTFYYDMSVCDERLRDSKINENLETLDQITSKDYFKKIANDMKKDGEIADFALNIRWNQSEAFLDNKFKNQYELTKKMFYEMMNTYNLTSNTFKEYVEKFRSSWKYLAENVKEECENILKAPFTKLREIPKNAKRIKYWTNFFFKNPL